MADLSISEIANNQNDRGIRRSRSRLHSVDFVHNDSISRKGQAQFYIPRFLPHPPSSFRCDLARHPNFQLNVFVFHVSKVILRDIVLLFLDQWGEMVVISWWPCYQQQFHVVSRLNETGSGEAENCRRYIVLLLSTEQRQSKLCLRDEKNPTNEACLFRRGFLSVEIWNKVFQQRDVGKESWPGQIMDEK